MAAEAEQTAERNGPRRRLYGPALLAGLVGSGGVAVAASHPWLRATAHVADLPTITATASGADLAPLAAPVGVAMLAAYGAVVATRGMPRRALGAAVVLAAVVVIVASLRHSGAAPALREGLAAKGWAGGAYQTSTTGWRWLVVAGAALAGAAGIATAAYGDQWAAMGSRYDAPAREVEPVERSAEDMSETDVWRAIDQGRDPTSGK